MLRHRQGAEDLYSWGTAAAAPSLSLGPVDMTLLRPNATSAIAHQPRACLSRPFGPEKIAARTIKVRNSQSSDSSRSKSKRKSKNEIIIAGSGWGRRFHPCWGRFDSFRSLTAGAIPLDSLLVPSLSRDAIYVTTRSTRDNIRSIASLAGANLLGRDASPRRPRMNHHRRT